MDALRLFYVDPDVAQLLQDMSHDDLCAFAEVYEDPQDDAQIDLFIFICFFIFLRTRSMDYLGRAVQRAEGWMAVAPDNQPERNRRVEILDAMLAMQYQMQEIDIASDGQFHRMQSINDLNQAIQAADDAVETTPLDHLDRAGRLNNLGNWLGRRFERTGEMADLNRAVQAADDAAKAIPLDHPDRAGCLTNLETWLGRRFKRTGEMVDLNYAVEVADDAVKATPFGHPDRAARLDNLGSKLGTRFMWTGEMVDLNRAVEATDDAIKATSLDHPNRTVCLNNLGNRLGRRFMRTGEMVDLNRAVEAVDDAVKATPLDHPNRVARLDNLRTWLGTRFKRTGEMVDLNRAVKAAEDAVKATPLDHPNRAGYLTNLGNWLGTRFERTGEMADLNRAVQAADDAVEATFLNHPNRAGYLTNLGNWLGRRFERTGEIDDLNWAVQAADDAIEATPLDHPERAGHLSNLGNWLGTRFERTGETDDLNRAVEAADDAVKVTSLDHPDRASHLINLGNWLGTRFKRTGEIDDLNWAVQAADDAIEATPLDHPERAGRLNGLGNLLGTRFERTGEMVNLNWAIKAVDDAIKATPLDHPDRAGRFKNLGILLGRQFERTGEVADLNRAVQATNDAIEATPLDHSDRAGRLNNLAILLGRQFERTGKMVDLNRAVEAADNAVKASPLDHPDRANHLYNLGNKLETRFKRTKGTVDLESSLASYRQGWDCRTAPPSIRIHLAYRVASFLASQLEWEESSNYLRDAVLLLPTVSTRLLQHTDKQHMLQYFAGLASAAAATALNAGKEVCKALDLLELGRGVIAGLLLDMRTDISDLRLQHPTLADEFASLRNELDSHTERTALSTLDHDTQSPEPQAKRRRKANQRLEELIGEIRSQPRLQRFLLPPSADELMTAAQEGPIVVLNVSPYRCDAFLIERHQIRALPLPGLNLEDLEKKLQGLRLDRVSPASSGLMEETLEWLWNVVTHPVLEALGFQNPIQDDKWPHIWWIPTGLLSHFPLHAAGCHMDGSTETVLDRVMSSYSPSIKALIYGRQHSKQRPNHTATEDAIFVSMQQTPGQSSLFYAAREVSELKKLCPSMQLNPVEPSQKTRKDVLECLRTSKVFHFAGHGHSHPAEPSQSSLLLSDWQTSPLTVADLRDQKLQESSPFLGYLSACSTGTNNAQQLTDEAIHLVSAFQLAGFRHVIGTLWEVSDPHCVDVAVTLYETLRDEGMTDQAVCRGLHRALRALRDTDMTQRDATGRSSTAVSTETVHPHSGDHSSRLERNAIPSGDEGCETRQRSLFYWVPYIHFGV